MKEPKNQKQQKSTFCSRHLLLSAATDLPFIAPWYPFGEPPCFPIPGPGDSRHCRTDFSQPRYPEEVMWLGPGQSASPSQPGLSDWFTDGSVIPASPMAALPRLSLGFTGNMAGVPYLVGLSNCQDVILKLGLGGKHHVEEGWMLAWGWSHHRGECRQDWERSWVVIWLSEALDAAVLSAMDFSVTRADKFPFMFEKKKFHSVK